MTRVFNVTMKPGYDDAIIKTITRINAAKYSDPSATPIDITYAKGDSTHSLITTTIPPVVVKAVFQVTSTGYKTIDIKSIVTSDQTYTLTAVVTFLSPLPVTNFNKNYFILLLNKGYTIKIEAVYTNTNDFTTMALGKYNEDGVEEDTANLKRILTFDSNN